MYCVCLGPGILVLAWPAGHPLTGNSHSVSRMQGFPNDVICRPFKQVLSPLEASATFMFGVRPDQPWPGLPGSVWAQPALSHPRTQPSSQDGGSWAAFPFPFPLHEAPSQVQRHDWLFLPHRLISPRLTPQDESEVLTHHPRGVLKVKSHFG